MILAAGRGERMRPLSDHTPKPLLEVAGAALIVHHLRRLAALGIADVLINTAWLGAQFHRALGDGAAFGLRIHYSDEGDQALETAGGIAHALALLGDGPVDGGGDGDPLLVINGDLWCDCDLARLALRGDDLATLLLVDNPEHNPRGDFLLRGGRVANPSPAAALGGKALTFAGIGLYRRALFAALLHPTPPQPLAPLLRAAADAGRVAGLQHRGDWCDVGTPERLTALRARLKKNH